MAKATDGRPQTDLNEIDHPDEFAAALRAAADKARDVAYELDAAWQDRAGRPWLILGIELDAAANRIEKRLARG